MRARCPHCSNVFNTDRGGNQFCPNCGKQINVPAPPGSPEAAAGQAPGPGAVPPPPPPPFPAGWGPPPPQVTTPTPWEQRSQRGLVGGFFETWKQVCFSPERFWSTLSPGPNWGDALLYSWILQTVSMLISAPLFGLQLRMQSGMLMRDSAIPPELRQILEAASDYRYILAYAVGSILLYPLSFVVAAGISHVLLLIFGAGKSGFAATARVFGYAASPSVVAALPCVGLFGILYWGVLYVWGLGSVHKVPWWRPLLALVLPWFLMCCCGLGLAFAAIGAAR